MLFWTGRGWIVLAAAFIPAIIVEALVGQPRYGDNPIWAAVSCLLAAAVMILLNRTILDPGEPRRLVDPKTNREVMLRRNYTFMFIPTKYWPYGFVVLGAGLAVAQLFHR